ncbi:hypothetical protein BDV98DRAFT_492302, partial [Pterulicium gracile]
GRPRELTEEDIDRAVEAVDNGTCETPEEVWRLLFPFAKSCLIRLRLSQQGLVGFHKQKKPLLTPNHI